MELKVAPKRVELYANALEMHFHNKKTVLIEREDGGYVFKIKSYNEKETFKCSNYENKGRNVHVNTIGLTEETLSALVTSYATLKGLESEDI